MSARVVRLATILAAAVVTGLALSFAGAPTAVAWAAAAVSAVLALVLAAERTRPVPPVKRRGR